MNILRTLAFCGVLVVTLAGCGGSDTTKLSTPPTGSVTIGGTPKAGSTLTASHTLADVDGLGAISYQWNADNTPISGATAATLVLTTAQVGKLITVSASYTDGIGAKESVTSSATAVVVVPGTVVTAAQMTDSALNTILFQTRPGDTVTLPPGKFTFNGPLTLTTDNVSIVGAGNGTYAAQNTILSFKGAASRNGVVVRNVKKVTLKGIGVEDAEGNGIFVESSTDVVMDTVRTEWTNDPVGTSLMAYGLYPVGCDNVLVVNSKAIGTRDAGVYVGQSTNIRVIGNEVYYNVAGIEIENSKNAVVEDNYVHDNTGGILIFALPSAPRFKDNVGTVVRNNILVNNNQPVAANATGFVTAVPPGTGILVLAAQATEIHGNSIINHKSTGILAVSFQATGFSYDRNVYDPHLRGLYAHDNTISNFGAAPGGLFADPAGLKPVVTGLFASLRSNGLPQRMPAVIWDGIVDPATGSGVGAAGDGGAYAGNLRICAANNLLDTPLAPGVISYENLDLNLIGLLSGLVSGPAFPFPPRMGCTLSLPAVTGLPS